MSERVKRAFLLLPDLEAVAASERAVAGMPLLARTICTLREAGVESVVIAAPGCRTPRVDLDAPRLRGAVTGSAAQRRDGAPATDVADVALVLRGDLVYMQDAVAAMVAAAPGTAVTGQVGGEWRAVACVVADAAGPAACAAVAARGLDDVVARRPTRGATLALLRESVLLAGTPAERRRAERALLQSLRKPTDGWFSRHLNRRISLFLTSLLMHTNVHPNHVSFFTLVLGLVGGIVCATGGWLAALVGALCLEAHSIIDGVDGELARLKHLRSPLGAWLDTVSDDLASSSFIVGLTVNLWRGGGSWALVVGGAAVAAAVIGRILVYWLLARVYGTGDQFALEWKFSAPEAQRGLRRVGAAVMTVLRALVKRDCFATVFVGLALVGRADVILVLCTAGALGYLAALLGQLGRLAVGRLRAAVPSLPGPARGPRAARKPQPVRRPATLEFSPRQAA
jgi:phosphatidylglycerophosphate synthase